MIRSRRVAAQRWTSPNIPNRLAKTSRLRDQIVDYIPWIVNLIPAILLWMEQQFEKAKQVLANNIKRKRRAMGLSQEALALSADVDRTYVSQIERGVGNPSLLILCRICDVLLVAPAELLDAKAIRR